MSVALPASASRKQVPYMLAGTKMTSATPPSSNECSKLRNHVQRSPRYLIVSGFCSLIHNIIMIWLDQLGFHFAFSQAVSAVVLLPTGYLLQEYLTFDSHRSWPGFLRYSLALISNYPVALIVLWILCDVLLLNMSWAAPISVFILFVWNYASSSWAFSVSVNRRS